MKMQGYTINELKVGQSAAFTKTVSESDVYLFAGVTGDINPAHVNEEYAKTTMFKTRIAHGMLGAGFISAVLGMQLPGPGVIYVKQDLKFKAPVKIGDTVTAEATVKEIDVAKNRVAMTTILKNQEGTVVIEGDAVLMPRK
jgi:3-hydroxybutyryl-CoA dehydratase